MPEPESRPTFRFAGAVLRQCPRCGGAFGEPVSGDVHCYVDCVRCGARFELDDPELVPPEPAARERPA